MKFYYNKGQWNIGRVSVDWVSGDVCLDYIYVCVCFSYSGFFFFYYYYYG